MEIMIVSTPYGFCANENEKIPVKHSAKLSVHRKALDTM
jgi:hypothetical protein